MFYVEKSLLHEALFGLSSESTSAHISTHNTTYSDGGRALRGRRWLPSRSNGDWRRSAHESDQATRTVLPDGARPQSIATEPAIRCCRTNRADRCANVQPVNCWYSFLWFVPYRAERNVCCRIRNGRPQSKIPKTDIRLYNVANTSVIDNATAATEQGYL